MIPRSWQNPVRVALQEGKPVVGITITTASVELAAQAAQLGFDFLWIEMEHSPITLESLRHMVLATRGLPAVPLARVPVVETWTAKRVLDMGVLGVIFPFCSTPELALTAAQATKYPPQGKRGHGSGLASFRWAAEEGYADFADRNVLTVAMIEEVRAIERIEEIAATPGLDVLFIGTSDLSFSMGFRGDQNHPRLQEACERVIAAARAHGKFVGRPCANSALIPQLLEQGFQFFQAPAEYRLLAEGAKAFLAPLRSTSAVPQAMY
ncbi:MAG: aldolase/citrate lyase family protein [Bryobacteraceae bacterium]|nr:aldolase/citrate lyase family protein [Bryobacteraceae bacterium]MDW8379903.1 aldolase/citrate lyase family protein [Bryobacterales bacterium]